MRRRRSDPGEFAYSRLSVITRIFLKVRCFATVKPGSFVPAPHVDAALLDLTPRPEALALDSKEWDVLIRLLFAR